MSFDVFLPELREVLFYYLQPPSLTLSAVSAIHILFTLQSRNNMINNQHQLGILKVAKSQRCNTFALNFSLLTFVFL